MTRFHIVLSICLIISNYISGRPINEITEMQNAESIEISTGLPYSYGDDLKHPTEVQKAVCAVKSGDVRASAEAFTTRELKGVCGSIEMLKSFNNLENKLSDELQNIHQRVQDLHRQFVLHNLVQQKINESSSKIVTSDLNMVNAAASTSAHENKMQKSIELSKSYYFTPLLKSLSVKDIHMENATAREKNISKYNNSFATDKEVKVYTYYWKIENITPNLKSIESICKESPIFSIRGKALKIKAHFQYLHRDYLYLQLEDYSSSPHSTLRNSILLDTGGIFKEIGSENFKYKMSILNQNKTRSSDLVSQEFYNYDIGFSIPNSALIDSPFIKDNSLLLKLYLYL